MRKQIAIRVEEDLLKEIRLMLVKEGYTLQEYLTELIIKDLEGKKDE